MMKVMDEDIMVYFDERKKQRQQIHDETCAIYQVIYEYENFNQYRNNKHGDDNYGDKRNGDDDNENEHEGKYGEDGNMG